MTRLNLSERDVREAASALGLVIGSGGGADLRALERELAKAEKRAVAAEARVARYKEAVKEAKSGAWKPRLRPGHFVCFLGAFLGLVTGNPVNWGTIILALVLVYDIHQLRVLREREARLEGKDNDDA